MKILVTGAKGFIGRNLTEELNKLQEVEIFAYVRDTPFEMLKHFTAECDFVYHLAAVHRPIDEKEFDEVNHLLFAKLLKMLRDSNNQCPILLSSSVQAGLNTAYGKSKLAAEEALQKHAEIMNSRSIIYRLTNTFGRYAKPNHQSVVATFCYNVAHGLPIVISDPDHLMKFFYIDDVISSFISHLRNSIEPDKDGFYLLSKELVYEITLKELADKIYSFKTNIDEGLTPKTDNLFYKNLYETYLSFINKRPQKVNGHTNHNKSL